MRFTSLSHSPALAVPALLLLAACGASTPSTAAATKTPSAAASSATSSPAPAGGSLPAALTVDDISDIGGFTQQSDDLLGGLANTDQRVFISSDSNIVTEVDLVEDTGASGAASDYPPYQSAAAKQVPTQSSSSTPGLGQQSDEYVGTDSSGKNAVSISFIEGRYIVVLTTFASPTLSSDTVKTTTESIAQAQDSKINSLGS